jgi:hypothetical protein
MKVLCQSLKINESLKSIFLRENYLVEDGAKYIADFLKDNCTLERLILENSISAKGFSYIANVLSKNNKSLKCLEVSGIVPTFSSSRKFSSDIYNLLSRNSTLEEIDISKNCLTSESAKLIFSALKFNSTLRILNISENEIEDDASVWIAEMIKKNFTLLKVWEK